MTAEFQQKALADLRKMASIYARLGATDKEHELNAMAEDLELRFEQRNAHLEQTELNVAN